MEWTWNSAVALATLTALEIVLGIDNLVLVAIVCERLPDGQRELARKIGLSLAMVARIALLLGAVWLTKLTAEIFSIGGHGFSWKDMVMIVGGLFLVGKATTEIFHHVEVKDPHNEGGVEGSSVFFKALVQIVLFDLIFSLDSVLTAVGLSKDIPVMVAAVIMSVMVMLIFSKSIASFVRKNPGIKLLALSFLVLIGVLLLGEGFGSHFDRGYVYFAMAFSLGIELLNRRRLQLLRAKDGSSKT